MEDDKTFELMSRMYSEFIEFRKETKRQFVEIDRQLALINDRTNKTGNQLTVLEFELRRDISALFDGYKLVYEKLNVIERKVDNISNKSENHEMRLPILERTSK